MSKIYVDEIAGIASPSTVAIPGHVIQVVSSTYATQVVNGTSTYADTGLTASITPSSSSSKILVVVTQQVYTYASAGGIFNSSLRILRDSTQVHVNDDCVYFRADGSSRADWAGSLAMSTLDSPASTSALTYKTQHKMIAGSDYYAQSGGSNSTITLMEIAG